MKYKFLMFALFCIIFSACSTIKDGKPSITQGVFGKVLWLEGNVMPGMGVGAPQTGIPAQRKIAIYELTKATDAEGDSPLFSIIKTKMITTVETDANGYFQCRLAPGKYSIFTIEEDGKLFASTSDGEGAIGSFEVKDKEVTTNNININYKASY